MFSIMTAAALAAAPVPADDSDVRCYAAVSLSLAGLEEGGKLDDETRTALTAILWYYYGRMESRLPGVDLAVAIAQLTSKPGYLTRDLPTDGERCGAEADAKGRQMAEMGKRLQAIAAKLEHPAS